MALRRMDSVLVVVEDLEAAKASFIELGMVLDRARIAVGAAQRSARTRNRHPPGFPAA